MSLFPADIIAEAEALVRDFTAAGIMVSTAESCTGGLIAGALTEIAGSSAVVDRGFVTYTNNAKMEMLGVQEATLARHGTGRPSIRLSDRDKRVVAGGDRVNIPPDKGCSPRVLGCVSSWIAEVAAMRYGGRRVTEGLR